MEVMKTLNGIEIVDAEARARISLLENYVTPEMHGAIGDGVTDDTQAIQECLNNNDSVLFCGKYLISSELKIKNTQKVTFFGGALIASTDFNGECAVRVVDNGTDGSITNMAIEGKGNNIVGLLVEACRHLTIENFQSIGCYNGGITVLSGYECLIRGFNIVYDKVEKIKEVAPNNVCGVKIMASDCELVQGNCVNYPIGCYLFANNRATNIHCWGMPHASDTDYNGGYMLIGFVCVEKCNTLTGCVADSPALLDITQDPSVTNGGIGFLEATTEFLATAYPEGNSYIGCNVTIHTNSPDASVICFHVGDAANNSGMNTTIVPLSFAGAYNKIKEKVKFVNSKLRNMCTVIGNHYTDFDITKIGWQDRVLANEFVFPRSDYAAMQDNEKVAVTKKLYIKLPASGDVLIAENVSWVHIDNMYLATAVKNITSASPGKVTISENVTFTRGLTDSSNFQLGTITTWHGTANVFVKHIGDNYYINQSGDGAAEMWIGLEITSGYHTN